MSESRSSSCRLGHCLLAEGEQVGTFPLGEAGEAQERFAKGGVRGRFVLTV